MQNFIKDIWDEVDQIHLEVGVDVPSPSSAASQIERIVKKINHVIELTSSDDAEINALLGYLGYHYNPELQQKINVEKCLKKAVENNRSMTIAWLYLGYYYFDSHEWYLALDAFNHIETRRYDSFDITLKTKITELKLCCIIKTKDFNSDPQAFVNIINKFINQLRSIDEQDRPYPIELYNMIASLTDVDKLIKTNTLDILSRELFSAYPSPFDKERVNHWKGDFDNGRWD